MNNKILVNMMLLFGLGSTQVFGSDVVDNKNDIGKIKVINEEKVSLNDRQSKKRVSGYCNSNNIKEINFSSYQNLNPNFADNYFKLPSSYKYTKLNKLMSHITTDKSHIINELYNLGYLSNEDRNYTIKANSDIKKAMDVIKQDYYSDSDIDLIVRAIEGSRVSKQIIWEALDVRSVVSYIDLKNSKMQGFDLPYLKEDIWNLKRQIRHLHQSFNANINILVYNIESKTNYKANDLLFKKDLKRYLKVKPTLDNYFLSLNK